MSNLLEKASILTTPTAYDNGKILSVKPNTSVGDFDFTRNSSATRVNAQGLVEDVQILSSNLVQNGDFSQEGSELITNGGFDSDTDWTKLNATISDGKGNLNGDGQTSLLYQNILTQDKFYKVTFTVSDYNEIGTALIINNNGTSYYAITTNGTFTIYFKHITSNGSLYFRAINGAVYSIDNVSVREVGQDWVLGSGWSIGEDKATCDGTDIAQIYQINVLTQNKTYKVTYTITSYVSGSVKAKLGDNIFGADNSANGTYTEYIYFNQANLNFHFRSNNFIGSITNISVKEVGQNWTLGSFTSIGNNVANIVNSTGELSLQQDIGVSQKTIKLTYTISNYSSGGIRPQYGAVNGLNRSANGTYAEIITGANLSSNLSFFSITANTTATITNISVIEITDDTNLPRINYEGFSYQDALGSELVLNGDFATDSNWSKGTGWSISGGVSTANNVPNLQRLSNTGNAPSVIGSTYKYSIDVSNVSGFYSFYIYGVYALSTVNTEGTIEGYVTATSTNGAIFVAAASAGGLISATIDNVSVKEYLGQEVVPDSGCGSWLFEPQSTNTVTYSEDFINVSWGKANSPTLISGELAPNGTLSATKISGTIGSSYIALAQSSSETATRSIYAKTVSGTGTAKLMSYHANTNNLFTLTEEWQRFELTGTTTTAGNTSFYVDFRSNSQTLNEFIIWGAQSEELTYATSYIPTEGSTVTRNQDVCNNGGSLATINSTEGTLYFETKVSVHNGNITLSDGTNNNNLIIGFNLTSGRIDCNMKAGGAYQFIFNYTTDMSINNKIGVRYKANDFALFVNGIKVLTDTSGITPAINTLNKINFSSANTASNNFYGKTKALAVWKEALSDEELIALTS